MLPVTHADYTRFAVHSYFALIVEDIWQWSKWESVKSLLAFSWPDLLTSHMSGDLFVLSTLKLNPEQKEVIL